MTSRRRKKKSGLAVWILAPWWLTFGLGVLAYIGIGFLLPALFAQVFSSAAHAPVPVARDGYVSLAKTMLVVFWLLSAMSLLRRLIIRPAPEQPARKASRKPHKTRTADGPLGLAKTERRAPRLTDPADSVIPALPDAAPAGDPRRAPVALEIIDQLSWQQFEQVIAASFAAKGFSAELTAEGADQGVDIVLRERDNVLLVQCKHWGSYRIGVKIVRELFGALHALAGHKAILVTSGELTSDAQAFCKQHRIGCFDRFKLLKLIDPAAMPPRSEIVADRQSLCPSCGGRLVERIAGTTGKPFRGCERYPRCKGTRAAL